ncbi:MAG: 30S ribosomal protein S4 [Ruminococcaceae bacterium]|nr:30S ribosomal protein S4 [Oscillospiraceae bacterium]MBO5982181.1 30S ribosomal protein S4 [Clostridia bacterium]MBO7216158.1 30S ribosomal protein S4 [Clostridia bacterium]MBO7245893.1 30S ribosomal protein S4 [Clostridia bacterium]MBO7737665.1 30S ribosomal protein S4 [Clostridia bacterium]
MARYTGPACRLCRREGTKLFLKGERCFSDKCAVARRGQAPGQHGAAGGRKRTKEYGLQLREKQKAKRYYGILEKQFKTYFVKADKKPGQTGENLLTTIERRLDNVVYRMGMAESRREARQLVIHGHFRVNGKKVDIPSVILKKGDVITLREASRKSEKIKMLIENISARQVPAWIDMDKENIQATISELPTRADVDFPIEEHLIVELYSK